VCAHDDRRSCVQGKLAAYIIFAELPACELAEPHPAAPTVEDCIALHDRFCVALIWGKE